MRKYISYLIMLCFCFLSVNTQASGTCKLLYQGLENNNEVNLKSVKNRFKRKDFVVLKDKKINSGDYVLSMNSSRLVADNHFSLLTCIFTAGDLCKTQGGSYKNIEEYSLRKVDENGDQEIVDNFRIEVGSGLVHYNLPEKRAKKLARKFKTCHYY